MGGGLPSPTAVAVAIACRLHLRLGYGPPAHLYRLLFQPSSPAVLLMAQVVSFMKEIGFDGRTIGRILCRCPEIFSANVDNTLRRKIQFLTDFGILRGQLPHVIRKYPELLLLDIHQTLRPSFSFKCGISHITLLHARLFPAYSAYEAKFFVERSDHIPSCAQMQNMVLPIQDFWYIMQRLKGVFVTFQGPIKNSQFIIKHMTSSGIKSNFDTRNFLQAKRIDREGNLWGLGSGFTYPAVSSSTYEDHRASFSLNLFPNGFSVGKPTEGMILPLLEETPESWHPYDRASMSLFSSIEYGWLPGDSFDDIPCKYFNGTVLCEVWDFRACMSKLGNNDYLEDEFPKVQKVYLKMGMENVVKDLPSILDDSWSYNDLLEVESRITRALQPVLFLNPDPSLDRSCKTSFRKQVDLGLCNGRLTTKQNDVSEINLWPTGISHVRDFSMNSCFESLPRLAVNRSFSSDQSAISISMPNLERNDVMAQVSGHALPVTSRMNCNSVLHFSSDAPKKDSLHSVLAPDKTIRDSGNGLKDFASLPEKRDRCQLQFMQEPYSKRPKQDSSVPYFFRNPLDQRICLLKRELHVNITSSVKQTGTRIMLQSGVGDVIGYSQSEMDGKTADGVTKLESQRTLAYQGGRKCIVKETVKILPKAEAEIDKENHDLDFGTDKSKQEQQVSFISSLLPQMHRSSGPSIEKCTEKETNKGCASRKRKSSHTSLVSSAGRVHSSMSKAAKNCVIHAVTRENQMSRNTKKAPKTRGKVASMSKDDTGSPVTVSSCGTQLRPNNFSLSGCSDPFILERFSKIIRAATRHGLRNRKNTINEHIKSKSTFHLAQAALLLLPEDSEECKPLMDKMCISKFLIGGNRNICKIRTITFVRFLEGNSHRLAVSDCWKLFLFESEKPEEHWVGAEVVFGEEDNIPIALLPSPNHADLFASQFISLMEREGYKLKNDQIQPTCTSCTDASSSNSVHIDSPDDANVSCTAFNPVQPPLKQVSYGTKISIPNPPHLLPPSNVPIQRREPSACSNLTSSKELNIVSHLSSMNEHYSHNQSSMVAVQDNLSCNSLMQLGGQITSTSRIVHPFQFQEYQQQQSILLNKICSLGASGNGIGIGEHISGITAPQIGDNLPQTTAFGHSGVRNIYGENSQVQATLRAKPIQTDMGLMEGIPVSTLADGTVKTKRTGSLLDQLQENSFFYQCLGANNFWTGPSNVPFKHMNYVSPKQMLTKEEKNT
ncbi:uncharacterized protein LOC109845778 [Asparagus officinalis]|uniref:uncharacterized protein LOC109845778 n=1 Tax=Asparagus officinalis TaxID=4686 RepID=UPI00098E2C2B|nr:uncharacterized protein LOC109845778 [Asparagus officinalis]